MSICYCEDLYTHSCSGSVSGEAPRSDDQSIVIDDLIMTDDLIMIDDLIMRAVKQICETAATQVKNR